MAQSASEAAEYVQGAGGSLAHLWCARTTATTHARTDTGTCTSQVDIERRKEAEGRDEEEETAAVCQGAKLTVHPDSRGTLGNPIIAASAFLSSLFLSLALSLFAGDFPARCIHHITIVTSGRPHRRLRRMIAEFLLLSSDDVQHDTSRTYTGLLRERI